MQSMRGESLALLILEQSERRVYVPSKKFNSKYVKISIDETNDDIAMRDKIFLNNVKLCI